MPLNKTVEGVKIQSNPRRLCGTKPFPMVPATIFSTNAFLAPLILFLFLLLVRTRLLLLSFLSEEIPGPPTSGFSLLRSRIENRRVSRNEAWPMRFQRNKGDVKLCIGYFISKSTDPWGINKNKYKNKTLLNLVTQFCQSSYNFFFSVLYNTCLINLSTILWILTQFYVIWEDFVSLTSSYHNLSTILWIFMNPTLAQFNEWYVTLPWSLTNEKWKSSLWKRRRVWMRGYYVKRNGFNGFLFDI